jgi:hypothetical protein
VANLNLDFHFFSNKHVKKEKKRLSPFFITSSLFPYNFPQIFHRFPACKRKNFTHYMIHVESGHDLITFSIVTDRKLLHFTYNKSLIDIFPVINFLEGYAVKKLMNLIVLQKSVLIDLPTQIDEANF